MATPVTIKVAPARTAAVPPTPYALQLEAAQNKKSGGKGKKSDAKDLVREARNVEDAKRQDKESKPKPKPRPVKAKRHSDDVKVKEEPLAEPKVLLRSFVDDDDESVEASAAKSSPMKNGVRKTSEVCLGHWCLLSADLSR